MKCIHCSKRFKKAEGKKFCSAKCKESNKSIRARRRLKRKAVEHMGGKCVRCGYNKCVAALQFHHKNPKNKKFGVSALGIFRSWDKVRKELKKCIMICANCHWEEHHPDVEDINGNNT